MLSTRLWMGSVLAAAVVGMVVGDRYLPGYPIQLSFQIVVAVLSFRELKSLLGPERSFHWLLALCGVLALNLSAWIVHANQFLPEIPLPRFRAGGGDASLGDPMAAFVLTLVVVLHLTIYLAEMWAFSEPGISFQRMARTWWVIAYLGLLPSFFGGIRWLYPQDGFQGTAGLALAVFVPKGCDIGAFCVGRVLGTHRMTPLLSPKKTWEGAVGGLVFAALIAIGIDRLGPAPVLRGSLPLEIAFGLTVGVAGMFGDLAESLIKRDCRQKDASHAIPGFGGVLDVVDAVIFAAPVAYLWFVGLRAL